MPVYYKYIFPPQVEDIFIDVTSNDDLCAVVSVQSFDCPVYDVSEIGVRQGHYQTMSKRASFNVYLKDFQKRKEFLIVFLVQPTDVDCLDYQVKTSIQPGRLRTCSVKYICFFLSPAGYIDIQRKKNVTVILQEPAYGTSMEQFHHLSRFGFS